MPTPPAELRAFVAEAPIHRAAILDVVASAAEQAPHGARVLDAGAGEAPYRPLFGHCEYLTQDWPGSVHTGARGADIIADLHELPDDLEPFDLVLCTEVLEHVREPDAVLAVLHRVLRPGGRLVMTVPFVGGLHEEPYDFHRFTNHALRMMLHQAGFQDVVVDPLTGFWSTLSHVLRFSGAMTQPLAGGAALPSRIAATVALAVSELLRLAAPWLDRLDVRRALPVGWSAVAVRPPA